MRENASHIGEEPRRELYPPIEPFSQAHLDMPGGHRIYVEQCGNPTGEPVVVLHGGPGGGCSPGMRRFFDPKHYRVILFDQRGCGRSTPHASVENNTTWDLVADIERIRAALKIDRWIVFGGSWGSTLALIYAQSHPERAAHLVLRGIFLMTKSELDWFYGGGVARFWPEEWAQFQNAIPEEEHDDLIAAYHRRLFGASVAEQTRVARAWAGWESTLASLVPKGRGYPPGTYARAFARLENHYFINNGFLPEDGYILNNMSKIAHIDGVIVQGRYDMICPPGMAYALHKAWPNSDLRMAPQDGHALSETGITEELLTHMDMLRNVSV